jgi:hypothetical protein
MRRRRDGDETLLLGGAIEAGHGAQPSGDGGPRPAQGLEVAGEALDVGASRTEHREVMFGAPGDVLPQVEGVGIAGEAAVAGQETRQRQLLVRAEQLARCASTVLVEMGPSTMEPPSVELRLQWPGPVRQPQQPSEAADRTSGQRDRSRVGNLCGCVNGSSVLMRSPSGSHDCSWSGDTLVEDGREELAASAARHRRDQHGRGEPYSRL